MTREEFIRKYGYDKYNYELIKDLDELLKQEAIGFWQWIYDSPFYLDAGDDVSWITEYTKEDEENGITTDQLYQLYKDSKNK